MRVPLEYAALGLALAVRCMGVSEQTVDSYSPSMTELAACIWLACNVRKGLTSRSLKRVRPMAFRPSTDSWAQDHFAFIHIPMSAGAQ